MSPGENFLQNMTSSYVMTASILDYKTSLVFIYIRKFRKMELNLLWLHLNHVQLLSFKKLLSDGSRVGVKDGSSGPVVGSKVGSWVGSKVGKISILYSKLKAGIVRLPQWALKWARESDVLKMISEIKCLSSHNRHITLCWFHSWFRRWSK